MKIREYEKGNMKAFVDVTFDACFVVKGMKIMNGQNGLFVAMPSQEKNGEYFDTAFPVTKEFRQELIDAVLDKYNDDKEEPDAGVVGSAENSSGFSPDEDEFPFR